VNAVVLLKECADDEEIRYFDFTSLYPAVMKKEKYPIGIILTKILTFNLKIK